MTDGLIVFTYAIILICGIVIGSAGVGAFWMKHWIANKLDNITIEITDEEDF